jgi:hypothetical protein
MLSGRSHELLADPTNLAYEGAFLLWMPETSVLAEES